MKSKTLTSGYVVEKLDRTTAPQPTFASTTKQVWKRIQKTHVVDFLKFTWREVCYWTNKFNNSPTVKLFMTNGNKYRNREKLEQWCRDYSRNRQAQRVVNHFGNPEPYDEAQTQMFINELNFGRL